MGDLFARGRVPPEAPATDRRDKPIKTVEKRPKSLGISRGPCSDFLRPSLIDESLVLIFDSGIFGLYIGAADADSD